MVCRRGIPRHLAYGERGSDGKRAVTGILRGMMSYRRACHARRKNK